MVGQLEDGMEIIKLKPCRHCQGTGMLPCNGLEEGIAKSRIWAMGMEGKAVLIPFLISPRGKDGDFRGDWDQRPGLAIPYFYPSGRAILRVYISVDKRPNWGGWTLPSRENYEEIDGHNIYYIDKRWGARDDVVLLAGWPPDIEEISQLLLGEKNEEVKCNT